MSSSTRTAVATAARPISTGTVARLVAASVRARRPQRGQRGRAGRSPPGGTPDDVPPGPGLESPAPSAMATVVDDDDAVGELVGLVEYWVVARTSVRWPPAPGWLTARCGYGVEAGGGLVQQQQAGSPPGWRQVSWRRMPPEYAPAGRLGHELLEHGVGVGAAGGGRARTGGRPSAGSRFRSSPARPRRTAGEPMSGGPARVPQGRRRRPAAHRPGRTSVASVRTTWSCRRRWAPGGEDPPGSATRSSPASASTSPKLAQADRR